MIHAKLISSIERCPYPTQFLGLGLYLLFAVLSCHDVMWMIVYSTMIVASESNSVAAR